jgi:hypothetical protein
MFKDHSRAARHIGIQRIVRIAAKPRSTTCRRDYLIDLHKPHTSSTCNPVSSRLVNETITLLPFERWHGIDDAAQSHYLTLRK